MKPTEFKDDEEKVAYALFDESELWDDTHGLPPLTGDQARYMASIASQVLLKKLEQQGIELVTPNEGMCYLDGKWQQLEQYQERSHAHHLCDETCPHPLYRLIPLQEETS